jgi:hypothetical protein
MKTIIAKNMIRTLMLTLFLLTAGLSGVTEAAPNLTSGGPNSLAANVKVDEWGYWVYLGNGVSVRFKIVQRNYENGNPLWTWQFRNDLSSKITYLKFEYTEYKPYSEKHTDYFPGSLRGGETFGGWSAFTATSTIQPSIRIVEIERE